MTLSEHNGNIIFKKGSTVLIKTTISAENTSRLSSAQFLLQLYFSLKKVMVHLPFRRCSCVYLLLFTNTFHKVLIIFVIFLRWIVSFVERKKEEYRVGCMWKLRNYFERIFSPVLQYAYWIHRLLWFKRCQNNYEGSSVESSFVTSPVKASP